MLVKINDTKYFFIARNRMTKHNLVREKTSIWKNHSRINWTIIQTLILCYNIATCDIDFLREQAIKLLICKVITKIVLTEIFIVIFITSKWLK